MSKTCLVCNTHHLEMISIFLHPEKLDSMLMLHWGLRATKDDWICRECCDEALSVFNLNQTCEQSNPHNPRVLVSDGTVLNPQFNSSEVAILPMHTKLKTEPKSDDELESKTDIFTVNVETKKLGGNLENTSETPTGEFPIKIENLGAASGQNVDDTSEGCLQYFKREMPFDNEDSDEINEKPFAFAEGEMCFVTSGKLETNQRTFTGERPYECPHCSKTFITSTRLKEHKRTHTGERPYACSCCSKTYITAASLHIHIRTHMKEKPFVCSECGKSCTTSQLLKYHKRTHTGERPYTCSYCPKSYITNGRLQRHMSSHMKEKDEGPFECLQCSKTFKSSWAHKVHIRMHTQEISASDSTQSSHQSNIYKSKVQNDEIDRVEQPVIEPIPSNKVKVEPQNDEESEGDFEISTAESETEKLPKQTRTNENAEHVPEAQSRTIEMPGVKNYLLFSEQKDYASNTNFQKPIKRERSYDNRGSEDESSTNHEIIKLIKYDYDSEFNLQHQLKNGENVLQGISQKPIRMHKKEKPFLCLECGKCFLTTTKLQIHKRTHTGERPYKCHLCPKTFVSSYKLTEHKRIHIGDKPYECRFCSKSFLRATEVQGHERTHTKEKPYICSECGKGFVTSSVLNRHKRIHTGVKPYVCSHCSKMFTSKFYLQTHIRTHTKENLFECSECGKSFTTSKLFQDHKMTHTGERPYACSHCSKTYINRSGLINHTRSHTKEERKRKGPYECIQCSKTFRNSCAHKVHALMHSKEANSSNFTQKLQQTNVHTEADLKNESPLVDQTEIAVASKKAEATGDKTNKQKDKYTEEKSKATADLKSCAVSSEEDPKFKTLVVDSEQKAEGISEGYRNYFKKEKSVDIEDKNNDEKGESNVFKVHKGSHNRIRPYICSHCSKTFHSSKNFRIHVRIHKKENSYVCFECGKIFISSLDFKRHKKTHTKERPYGCSYCSKTYINSGHMQKHMRIHTRENHNLEKSYEWKERNSIDPQQKLVQPIKHRPRVLRSDGKALKHEISPVNQAEITIYSSDDGLVEDFDILGGETEKT